jgi:hypothetical protein
MIDAVFVLVRAEDENGRAFYVKKADPGAVDALDEQSGGSAKAGEEVLSWTRPMLPLFPPDWLKMTDPESGRDYYVHPPTLTSQWERPELRTDESVPDPREPVSTQSRARGDGEDVGNGGEGVSEVYAENFRPKTAPGSIVDGIGSFLGPASTDRPQTTVGT